eukprot:1155084-Pelagomonas_calceolata.AAC.3
MAEHSPCFSAFSSSSTLPPSNCKQVARFKPCFSMQSWGLKVHITHKWCKLWGLKVHCTLQMSFNNFVTTATIGEVIHGSVQDHGHLIDHDSSVHGQSHLYSVKYQRRMAAQFMMIINSRAGQTVTMAYFTMTIRL